MYLKSCKTYCIVNLTQDESYYPNQEYDNVISSINSNFPNFKKLGTVFLKSPYLFTKIFPIKEYSGILMIGEPFSILKIDTQTQIAEVIQTHKGETIIGYNLFYPSENAINDDYNFGINFGDTFTIEYEVYGE